MKLQSKKIWVLSDQRNKNNNIPKYRKLFKITKKSWNSQLKFQLFRNKCKKQLPY